MEEEDPEDAGSSSIVYILHLRNNPYLFWGVVLVVPLLFTALVASIPLNDPCKGGVPHNAMLIFATYPLMFTGISYVFMAVQRAALGYQRHFQVAPGIVALLYVGHCALWSILLAFRRPFSLQGFVGLAFAFASSMFVMHYYMRSYLVWSKRRRQTMEMQSVVENTQDIGDGSVVVTVPQRSFAVFALVLLLYAALMTGYIISFRELEALGQTLLAIGWQVVTFAFRKITLSAMDRFPLQMQMLFSGLFVENMDDLVQTLAFPIVEEPRVTFPAFVVINTFANMLNLFFLTVPWFNFRVFVKRLFSGKARRQTKSYEKDLVVSMAVVNRVIWDEDPAPADYEHILGTVNGDRGHSLDQSGYKRRQIRFFFWKVVSQASAMAFFLAIGLTMRRGPNRSVYPMQDRGENRHFEDRFTLDEEGFRNANIFAMVNLIVIVSSGVLGWRLVRTYHPLLFAQIKALQHAKAAHRQRRRNYIGLVTAIFATNSLIAVLTIQQHSGLFFAFLPQCDDVPFELLNDDDKRHQPLAN